MLFATTHLHYAQNLQENNYILLLTLTGLLLQLKWLKTGSQRALFWGSMALGLNLLTRITTVLDLFAVGGFVFLAFWLSKRSPRDSMEDVSVLFRTDVPRKSPSAVTYLLTALPVYAVFFFFDRWYQWVRFGSWTNTYVSIFAREERRSIRRFPGTIPSAAIFSPVASTRVCWAPFFIRQRAYSFSILCFR